MRSLLNDLQAVIIWILFFATTVYGHVALKIGVGDGNVYDIRKAFQIVFTFWGISTLLAWIISAVLWVILLTRHSVISANAISCLRYVLIWIAAFLFVREPMQSRHVIGAVFIVTGIWITTSKI